MSSYVDCQDFDVLENLLAIIDIENASSIFVLMSDIGFLRHSHPQPKLNMSWDCDR